MLSSLLKEKINNQNLSVRATAKIIGVSHTTLIRAMKGEIGDLDTIMLFSSWLGVKPTDLLNSLNSLDNSLPNQISVTLSQTPKLAKAFEKAMKVISSGKVAPHLIEDIAAYAVYRINLATDNENK
jgi:transcriptional regulator with XRE-family HTH domain